MSSAYPRRTGTIDHVGAGRRRLAAIDPAVMARVVGRPAPADVDAARRAAEAVPAHRRPY